MTPEQLEEARAWLLAARADFPEPMPDPLDPQCQAAFEAWSSRCLAFARERDPDGFLRLVAPGAPPEWRQDILERLERGENVALVGDNGVMVRLTSTTGLERLIAR